MEVSFQYRYEPSAGWDDEDNVSPYIPLASPATAIEGQRFPDEIVIPLQTIRVEYEYPFNNPATFTHQADKPEGFTRAHLAREIASQYQRIYQEEEAAVGNPGHIPGMMNRQRSAGPYGIWGHDLGDLVLHSVSQDGSELDLFHLGVDS